MRLNTVRNRLVLLFFAITTAAIGFMYLYVVPQLRSSLTAEKLARLESAASEHGARLARAMSRGSSQERLRRVVRQVARQSDARVTVLGLERGGAGHVPAFVVGDSELERTAVEPRYAAAVTAAATGTVTSAVEHVHGKRVGETAVALEHDGEPRWAVVLSVPLDEVEDNVALIQRQILIAGAIALAAALLAGYFAARAHSRRLSRLERAAEKVADGNFDVPIPVDSSDEVGQLAITLNEMQRRLASLDGARKEFIANASHELRTPIFSLGGFVELLEHEQPDPAAREEFLREMREQVERLGKLTGDLLDLSKLDADAIELRDERVDLGELAAEVAAEFRPAADHRRSSLEVRDAASGGAAALADPDRVAQILRILIDNALTHTPQRTRITVETTHRDGSAGVVVRDTGPGIDRRSRQQVFDRFVTGDSVSGSGLGLAIAHELATRMHGSLVVFSRRGLTEFALELPATDRASAGPPGALR